MANKHKMTKPTDNVTLLAKIAKTMEIGHWPSSAKVVREAAAEIERLREERDEARRQYCRGFTDFCPDPALDHLTLEEAAVEVAKGFGWDCFKEDADD